MARPVLLLDVDGVVNAISKKPPTDAWPEAEWLSFETRDSSGDVFPMLVAAPVVRVLNSLHRERLVEVRWHSTWRHDAKLVGELAGFEDFDVAAAPEFDDYRTFQQRQIRAGLSTWWKLPAAERVVRDEKRPLVWLDDDLYHEYLRRPEADERLGGGQLTLLLRPDQRSGLTDGDLRKVQAFVTEVDHHVDDV